MTWNKIFDTYRVRRHRWLPAYSVERNVSHPLTVDFEDHQSIICWTFTYEKLIPTYSCHSSWWNHLAVVYPTCSLNPKKGALKEVLHPSQRRVMWLLKWTMTATMEAAEGPSATSLEGMAGTNVVSLTSKNYRHWRCFCLRESTNSCKYSNYWIEIQ